MRTLILGAALIAAATPAAAQVVDGQNTGGTEYAAGTTAVVRTDPTANGDFQSPTDAAPVGYTIQLTDTGGSLYGLLTQTGGQPVGTFANLYFDLNPTVGDGSDLGFELGLNSATAFIPGKNGLPGFSTLLDPSLYSTAAGNGTFEFRLDNSLFTGPIAGLAYYDGQTFEGTQTLRLSQSFSYAVAGGGAYGANRLGAFSVNSAVPEPSTWALMLLGFGAMGVAMRRQRRASTARALTA